MMTTADGTPHGSPAGNDRTGPADHDPPPAPAGNGQPAGEVYDWYRRGMHLLDSGHAAAAAQLLSHAALAEPSSRSIREALARAQLSTGQYRAARQAFLSLLEANPDDDYAHFGYGLSCWRLGDLGDAAEHLALATAMRPTAKHYAQALQQVRATLRARG